MAYALNTTYHIKSFAGSGRNLNVYGNEQVSYNRNVCLWSQTSANAQKWVIMSFAAGLKIITALSSTYALNYYWANGQGNPGNCDIYPHASNNQDSCITLVAVNAAENIYKIKLANYNLYMTAASDADEANVSWEEHTGAAAQQWKFVPIESSEGGSSDRTVIDLPSNRDYNWNQFYTGVTNAINSTAGCAWTCGLDIANIYGPNAYAPSDMAFAWSSGGYGWDVPDGCAAAFNKDPIEYSSNSEYFSKIRSEINNNRPVVVKMVGATSNHFVVAYGYTGSGNSTAEIKVLDPAQSTSNTYTQYGRDTTLQNAISWNSMNSIDGLILVSTDR